MSHFLIVYGSWCLAPFGLLGMYLAGQKKTWGWLVSMGTQSLWALYAVGTGQYGFLIGTCSYFAIYLKNYLAWRKEETGLPPGYGQGRCTRGRDCTDPKCVKAGHPGVTPQIRKIT